MTRTRGKIAFSLRPDPAGLPQASSTTAGEPLVDEALVVGRGWSWRRLHKAAQLRDRDAVPLDQLRPGPQRAGGVLGADHHGRAGAAVDHDVQPVVAAALLGLGPLVLFEHDRVEVAGEPLDLDQALVGGAGPTGEEVIAQPGGLAVVDRPAQALQLGDDPRDGDLLGVGIPAELLNAGPTGDLDPADQARCGVADRVDEVELSQPLGLDACEAVELSALTSAGSPRTCRL